MEVQERIVSVKRHTIGYVVNGREYTRLQATKLARQGKISQRSRCSRLSPAPISWERATASTTCRPASGRSGALPTSARSKLLAVFVIQGSVGFTALRFFNGSTYLEA
jgi:hypothetical protein